MARFQTVSWIECVELFDIFKAHGGNHPAVGFLIVDSPNIPKAPR